MVKRRFLTGFVIVLAFLLPAGRCLADVSAQLEQGERYADEGQYQQAEAIYKQIVAENPGTDAALDAQEKLTILYVRQEKLEEADAAYQRLLADFGGHAGLAQAVDHVGDAYREAGEYEKALPAYEEVVARWPEADNAIECQKNVVVVNILRGEAAAAEEGIDELLSKFGGNAKMPRVIEGIAEQYFDREEYPAAKRWYEHVVSNWPDAEYALWAQVGVAASSIGLRDEAASVTAIEKLLTDYGQRDGIQRGLEELADNYLRSRQYDKAIQLYERVVKGWPATDRAVWVQRSLARSYILSGDEPNGIAATDKLVADYGGSDRAARAVRQIADCFSQMSNHEKAGELYRLILTRWPQSDEAIMAQQGLVTSRIRQWDLDGAEAELGNLLTDFAGRKDLPDAVHEIVEEYRNTGAHEESRELFNYLLTEWSTGGETMLELQVGIALQSIKLREPNRVEAAIEQLIADYNDHPKIAKALFQIAEEFYYAHKYDKAIEVMELVLSGYQGREYPGKGELPFMLALCQRKVGRYDDAIKNLRVCVEQYPESRFSLQAPYSIGLLYLRQKKDYEQAAYWFEQQLERYPNSGFSEKALHHLGWCYLGHLKDYVRAAEVYEEYIANYPNDVCVWACYTGLARCYAKLGDADKALTILQTAHEKADNDKLRGEFAERITALEKGGVP
ncbi:MAG TPA: tetratricopeptide repeat protein [Sedimentisphaerales bacterium]|nr:tetratricopeptide repeat protein [Sedimentisphaerales bacterium]